MKETVVKEAQAKGKGNAQEKDGLGLRGTEKSWSWKTGKVDVVRAGNEHSEPVLRSSEKLFLKYVLPLLYRETPIQEE